MSKINPVNTPVHVHAAIHYVRDLFQKSTNFKTRLTCKDSIFENFRQQNRKLQKVLKILLNLQNDFFEKNICNNRNSRFFLFKIIFHYLSFFILIHSKIK